MTMGRRTEDRSSYLGQTPRVRTWGQHWFEVFLRYAVVFGLGMGAATLIYDLPQLQAQHEFATKLIAGKYPGLFVAQGQGQECIPLPRQALGPDAK